LCFVGVLATGARAAVPVTLCHKPDTVNVAQTMRVGRLDVAEHLAHGDSLGACPTWHSGPPAPVAKTGQTGCWGNPTGYPSIDCAGSGQDGEYQKGVAANPRFTEAGDGTVKDNLTGLVWLQNANCFGASTWFDALESANSLASGACGLTDGSAPGKWRLPNIKELQSIVDYGQSAPALPLGHPFDNVLKLPYWSSSTLQNYPASALLVHLFFGNVFYDDKPNTGFVWPVRD
jgi:hypothetical protein